MPPVAILARPCAVADLLAREREVEITAAALDQWTSRGYVQGRASEKLAALHLSKE